MIKELLVSSCVASALCFGGYLILPQSEVSERIELKEEGEGEEEGFGVNMGSRKYWEYIRLANEDGVIPAHIEDRVLAFTI